MTRDTYTMERNIHMRAGYALLVVLALVLATVLSVNGATPASAQTLAADRVGIVCTDGPSFTLTTKTGYISLPDANTMFMWGFSSGSDSFQHPGPVLCVNQGDTVTVVLNNTLPEPVSIMFPGQENVLANGVPAQPEFDGGALTSLTNTAAANGGTVTYSFVASEPGTYLYESGTDPETQVRMGLFGALIVRPTVGSNFAYNRADSQFDPSEEFMVLLSEIDPFQHQAVEQGKPFNMNTYHPRYWLINGRGFPDSIADNFASWLPTQPYGALAQIQEFDPANLADMPGMARYLNVGTEDFPFHPHGNNGLVVGRDGRPLEGPTGQDLSFEKFAINIGPGQTWDVIFKWFDAESYNGDEFLPDGVTPNSDYNPVPVTIPDMANQVIGVFYSGSPYLGKSEVLPTGTPTLNQCGEYYIISHNHALFQITSWGANMTGPITYMRIDPPLPNTCTP